MRTPALRVLALMICLTIPCAAVAEAVQSDETIVHTEFTLGLSLHADGFPLSAAHLKGWESFLSRLTLSGSADTLKLWQPGSRVYIDGALDIDGEDVVPFIYDGYDSYRFLVSPALCCDSVLFQMHNFLEFMLKPFYYMEMPTPYIAVLMYPSATVYIANSYYTPIRDMIMEARAAALAAAEDELANETTYVISYERMLALCEELNAVVTDDEKLNRVRRYLDALLSELYLSDVVLDVLAHFELILETLDPSMEGMTVTETADGMTCTVGGTEVFQKTTAGGATEIAFRLPLPGDCLVSAFYRAEDTDGAQTVSAGISVYCAEEEAVTLTVEGEGLPVEDALSGAGSVTAALSGSVFWETPAPLTLDFNWSRTAAELPYTLDLTVDWIHSETQLPAISLYFSGALELSDYSVFDDTKMKEYTQQDFFSLNAELLSEYKERWGYSLASCLVPLAMEMPLGVIDDVVNFMLDEDILLSLSD